MREGVRLWKRVGVVAVENERMDLTHRICVRMRVHMGGRHCHCHRHRSYTGDISIPILTLTIVFMYFYVIDASVPILLYKRCDHSF